MLTRRNLFQHIQTVIAYAILWTLFELSGLVESTLAQGDTLLGTWKLNAEKSTFVPGPPPKQQVRTYTDVGSGAVKLSVEGLDSGGKPYAFSATPTLDGKDYPMTGTGIPNGGESLAY